MKNYIELNNKREVAKILAGYSSYTRALYKGIYFDRAWYNIENINQGIKTINKRLEDNDSILERKNKIKKLVNERVINF